MKNAGTTRKASPCARIQKFKGGLFGVILPLAVLYSPSAWAADGRPDFDLDDDSLIEIDDLDDLNAIREAPFGTSLYGKDDGCPSGGCHGFELTTDLDFDTSGDGVVDENDAYWNDDGSLSYGWFPIELLATTFEGNGHSIRHLTMIGARNAPSGYSFSLWPQGLFSDLVGATVRNLRLVDVHMESVATYSAPVTGLLRVGSTIENVSATGTVFTVGDSQIGGLAGLCQGGHVEESWTNLDLQGSGWVGGLLGEAQSCTIDRSFVLGRTASARYHGFIGGLVGYMTLGTIDDSFVSGSTGEGYWYGGLIGQTDGTPVVTNSFVSGAVIGNAAGGGALLGVGDATFVSSFYATDTTGFEYTEGDGAVGVTLADLKCPDTGNDPDCLPGLYSGWDAILNSDGQPAWDFGNRQQVPALRIRGVVYRDSDGDGVLDGDDDFPNNWAASVDTDGDGAIDFWREGCGTDCRATAGLTLDQFPESAAATLDLDLDGQPEGFNAGCGFFCQWFSGLSNDPFPGDFDNDGQANLVDQDDDDDGSPDVDLDSDGLIDIHDLAQLKQVDYDPTGSSLRTEFFTGDGVELDDVSGCIPKIARGILVRECDGYELLADLDFDTDGDGDVDENDDYWDDGLGWYPLGHLGDDKRQAFQTNFEGNGHTISNLYEDRFNEAGLFGGTRGASIRNLGLIGDAMLVIGDSRSGALVGDAVGTTITNCYATGPVHIDYGFAAGGLVGDANGSTITGSFATGHTSAFSSPGSNIGGLVGRAGLRTTITASFATGNALGNVGPTGGLVGYISDTVTVSGSYSVGLVVAGGDDVGGLVGLAEQDVSSSYWATDRSGLTFSAGNAQGALFAELQCPTSASNVDDCVPSVTLYDGWGSYVDQTGAAYWNFGDPTELPGLCLGGTLYRVSSEDPTELLPQQSCAGIDNGDLIVDVDVYDEFTGGYCAYLTVTNTGTTAVNPWSVDFVIEGAFSGGWNANYSQSGNVLSATPVGWNNYLGPGQSTHDIGFCATVPSTSGGGGEDGGILVDVEVVDEFPGGYCTVVTLTNTTTAVIDPWEVTFEVDGTVNDFWNTTWSQAGNEVTITPVGWNSSIGAGQTLSGLGYCADL